MFIICNRAPIGRPTQFPQYRTPECFCADTIRREDREHLHWLAGIAAAPLIFGACVPVISAPPTNVATSCKPYTDSVAKGAPAYDQVQFAFSSDGTLTVPELAVLFAMDRARSCATYTQNASQRLGPRTFDCSGLVHWAYSAPVGIITANNPAPGPLTGIPNATLQMHQSIGTTNSRLIPVSQGTEQPGDLAFYDTDGDGVVNHVGIVTVRGWIVHAEGTPYGLTIKRYSNSADSYSTTKAKFKGFARIS